MRNLPLASSQDEAVEAAGRVRYFGQEACEVCNSPQRFWFCALLRAGSCTLYGLLTAICLILFTQQGDAQRDFYFGRTTDPAPVVVELQDANQIVKFKIPKVYMTFSDNWKGGLQSGIAIQSIFPSMAPVSATRNSMVGRDVLIINLRSYANPGARYDVRRLLKKKIESWWFPVDHFSDNLGQTYRVYVEKGDVDNWRNKQVMLNEFLVPPNTDDIYFKCLRETGNPGVGCTGVMNFGENLSLEFQFRRSVLEHWPQFRDATVRLLNSFRDAAEN